MQAEDIVQLNQKQMDLCKKITDDAVEYFRIKKSKGVHSGYKIFSDVDNEKRWKQTMCGVMAELAVDLYLDKLKIKHQSNIISHS